MEEFCKRWIDYLQQGQTSALKDLFRKSLDETCIGWTDHILDRAVGASLIYFQFGIFLIKSAYLYYKI